jgi:NDP-sugar pyrophosphorylase family protein
MSERRFEMLKTKELFDLSHTDASGYLAEFEYPWQALKGIENLILMLGKTLDKNEFNEVNKNVWIHKSAVISPTAYIGSPCIIDEKAEVRHCAFIRSSALIGKNCVIGNSTELKNVIIFDEVQIPHYNYIGDSILGYKAHMGAGSITSNVKSDKTLVVVKDCYDTKEEIETGLKKFGAMLGDYVEVGCNSVLNPGTVVGKNSSIYPTSCVRGVIPANHIFKDKEHVIIKK